MIEEIDVLCREGFDTTPDPESRVHVPKPSTTSCAPAFAKALAQVKFRVGDEITAGETTEYLKKKDERFVNRNFKAKKK